MRTLKTTGFRFAFGFAGGVHQFAPGPGLTHNEFSDEFTWEFN